MGRLRDRVSGCALAGLAVVTSGILLSPASAGRSVNCAEFGNVIDFNLKANLEISEHGTKCLITGIVDGNVTVTDDSTVCAPPPQGMGQQFAELTAAQIIGGTVEGNLNSSGGFCAMVWLRDGTTVEGNLTHGSDGNLGFLDVGGDSDPSGSTVAGNVRLIGGRLFATSVATDNRVDGHIVCAGGVPNFGPGTETDWDGDGDTDGTIGGHYKGC